MIRYAHEWLENNKNKLPFIGSNIESAKWIENLHLDFGFIDTIYVDTDALEDETYRVGFRFDTNWKMPGSLLKKFMESILRREYYLDLELSPMKAMTRREMVAKIMQQSIADGYKNGVIWIKVSR